MYEWYVTTSDGSSTVTGPVWQFNTVEDIPPVVLVGSPYGGQALTMGQIASLQWSATDGSGVKSVDLRLSRAGPGGPWETLGAPIPNTGSFDWWVTGPPTNNAVLLVAARDPYFNEAQDVGQPFQIIETTGVGDGPVGPLALEPVAPNPTPGPSRFVVALPQAGTIRLDILDVAGRQVALLADGFQPAGRLEFAWDGRSAVSKAPAGHYFVRLEAAGHVLTRRFAVAR
jgi:hypothetical protein